MHAKGKMMMDIGKNMKTGTMDRQAMRDEGRMLLADGEKSMKKGRC